MCFKSISKNCRAVECDRCLKWCQFKCSSLSLCKLCSREVLPFYDLDNYELLELSFNSNTVCYCSSSTDYARLMNLPYLNITSSISKLPNLNEVDVDLNFPTHTNSKYDTPHEFHSRSSPDICNLSDKSLSFLRCNIRGLSANFGNLQHILSNPNHSFKVIGLSETWISSNKYVPCQFLFARLSFYFSAH